MSSRSLARRPGQRLGRRPIPPGSSSRARDPLSAPRGGIVSRQLPAVVIVAALAAVIVVALGQLRTAKSSSRTETEVVTASDGVVQSTVTGTGSLEPVTAEDVDFETSGTLAHVDVKDNEYVKKGALLATLDDTTASLTLKQAKATLADARTTLSSDQKSLDSSSSTDTSDTVEQAGAVAEDVSYSPVSTTRTTTTPARTATTPSTGTTSTTPAQTPTQTQTQTTTAPTRAATTETTTTTTTTTPATTTSSRSGTTGSGSTGASSTSGSSSTVTAATVDADKLQIVEDEQTVKEDQQALEETRLRAPVSGTITSLESISPGDSVSSGSTSSAGGSSSSSTSTTAGASSSSSAGSSSSSSGSSSFAVIDSLRHLSMTVSFTEADINKLKVGQAAVVTLDALSDLRLAGKVTEVSSIGTTSNDVTSYDATITLDQYDSRVKPGMSASAEVVIKQAHGVTVPSGAVTGTGNLASVTQETNGRRTTKRVIVGLRGDSRDLIVSGLSSGAELVETETLPSLGSSAGTSSSSSSSSRSAAGGLSRSLTGGGGGFPSGFGGGAPGAGAGVP